MANTLLLYDGKMSSAERIANRLCYLIGNAMVREISEAPEDLSAYDGFCFIFNFYGAVTAGKVTSYLRAHKDAAFNKRIALVGIGFSDLGFMNYLVTTEKATGLSGIEGFFLNNEKETNRVGTEIGKMMRAPLHKMEEASLQDRIESFILSHNTLALATSTDDYVRCTPLEYIYEGGQFYIITEGGNKFRGIIDNGRVSASVFDAFDANSETKGLQFHADARVVPIGSEEYLNILAMKGVTEEALSQMPIILFVIKITPLRFEFLDISLKHEGFDAHQVMTTHFQKETWEKGAAFREASAKALEKAAQSPLSPASSEEEEDDIPALEEEDELYDEEGEMSAREARRIISRVASTDDSDEDDNDQEISEDEQTEDGPIIITDDLEAKITSFLSQDDEEDEDDFEYDGSLLDGDEDLED